MTTVFVYEYCCARRPGRENHDPAASLDREGRAMRDAVVEDFRRSEYAVLTLDDVPDDHTERSALQAAARRADAVLLIAPETGGVLETRYEWAAEAGANVISSGLAGIRAAGRKSTTAALWHAANVPTPRCFAMTNGPPCPFPLVLKPDDGAGSADTRVLTSDEEWGEAIRAVGLRRQEFVAQDYAAGQPTSVAFLVGPTTTVALLPLAQLLSADGRLRYDGGAGPLDPGLADRAVALGRRAVESLPGLRGWVGVDIVLGDAPNGGRDVAIEVNPRLTTSYVGLRTLAADNLADLMVRVAAGQPLGPIRWNPGRVRFRPDGAVARSDGS